ncbi:MAG: hypothetical protein L6420_07975 [Elusimicrobia bacterium]|nr:hypothetical protein [Elusimicrobiota bacterium]
MKMKLITAVVGLAAFGLSGCTSISKNYPVNKITSGIEIMPLYRNEYKVLGDTQGEACAKYLLGGKLPWFSGTAAKTVSSAPSAGGNFLASLPIIGMIFGGQPMVIQEATYEALEKVPGADALISMRVKMHRNYSIPFVYSEQCANVQGKAFTIKTDADSVQKK